VTSGPTAAALLPGDQPGSAAPPRLAEGVQLLGEYKDSGYSQPPSLVRRPDGQVIQMSRLLYLVTCRIDGFRGPAGIAELVSHELGRSLSAEQVRHLITAKLLPLGIVAGQDAPAAAPKASPLLTLRARGTLVPERIANAVGVFLRPLFWWPIVAVVVVSVAALDYWLFAGHGLTAGIQQLLRDPADLLIVAGLSVASALFHECGHAAGCRYGGARPGAIGAGIYLIWPSFFTNVTDSYRLGRVGRLRTDLGGLYFNLVFMLGLAGVFAVTSAQILLLVVAITHVEMLQQLLPFVRFDGYFILSDLVGVPDLFARVTPILKSAMPAGWFAPTGNKGRRDPRVAGLRPRARITVTTWVLCVIPLLTFMIGYFLACLPRLNRALWRSASQQAHQMAVAAGAHHYGVAAVNVIGAALAILPIAGSVYVVTGLARQTTAIALRWSAGRPGRRLLAAAAALGFMAALAACWVTQGQLRGW
jgi:putative peptide zinc metalloprotease protein